MEKLILRLSNGAEFNIETSSVLQNTLVIFEDKESMIEAWEQFTPTNLKVVQVTDSEGTLNAEYTNLVLDSVTLTEQSNGTILTSFKLREKTEVELVKEELAAQKEETAMLTDCLLEMSEIVYGM